MPVVTILGIESSCDDTSAAIIQNGVLKSNIIASQTVHAAYGGVVPELASRAHQQHIIPVVHEALRQANVSLRELNAIAFTRGPGLLGSLLVGTSFAKGLAQALDIPLVDVDHLQAHVLAHFISEGREGECFPEFPFLCLLVSGGNSQIILVNSFTEMTIIGQTIDDAAGEAFDKCAKLMGFPYPGGPYIDECAQIGNSKAFQFNKPHIQHYNYSFSGLKTSFLYLLRDKLKTEPHFIEKNINDLSASLQRTIVEVLMDKLSKASKDLNIKQIALAGGVSANSGLRNALLDHAKRLKWQVFIPPLSFTTDNAAMIAITGYHKYLARDFCALDKTPYARVSIV